MKFAFANRRILYLGGGVVLAMAAATYSMIGMGGKSSESSEVVTADPGVHSATSTAAPATGKATIPPGGPPARPGTKAAPPKDTSPEVPQEDVLQRAKYTYRSLGRTDPFYPLVAGPMAATRFNGDQIDPEVIRLVGVLEKNGERRALVEDARGFGYVLRSGDRVLRGKVVRVEGDFITIRHSLYGVTETMTLQLHSERQGRFRDDKIR